MTLYQNSPPELRGEFLFAVARPPGARMFFGLFVLSAEAPLVAHQLKHIIPHDSKKRKRDIVKT